MIDYVVFFSLCSMAVIAYFIRQRAYRRTGRERQRKAKTESFIEQRLYDALVIRGEYVQTQVRCGPYRIDLTLPAYRLAIECDGKAYHSSPKQKAHDWKKNRYLRQQGWRVLRFTGSAINSRLPQVLRKIEEHKK